MYCLSRRVLHRFFGPVGVISDEAVVCDIGFLRHILGKNIMYLQSGGSKNGKGGSLFLSIFVLFPRCTKCPCCRPVAHHCSACCTKVTQATTWLVREDDPRKSKNAATETAAITPISNQLPICACCMYKTSASFPKSDTLGVLHR